jgi:hypothetical protein
MRMALISRGAATRERKIPLLIAAILLALTACAAQGDQAPANDAAPGLDLASLTAASLSGAVGNPQNGGLVASDGEWVVYANGGDYVGGNDQKLYRMRVDGSEPRKLSDNLFKFINIVDGYVYCTTTTESGHFIGGDLYKISIDGSEREQLAPGLHCKYVIAAGEWLFFSGYDRLGDDYSENLYRMRVDGEGLTAIAEDVSGLAFVDKGWIYFTRWAEGAEWGNNLYRVRADGSGEELVTNEWFDRVILVDGYIYFNDYNDDLRLYRRRLEGGAKERLTDDGVSFQPERQERDFIRGAGELALDDNYRNLAQRDGTGTLQAKGRGPPANGS